MPETFRNGRNHATIERKPAENPENGLSFINLSDDIAEGVELSICS